MQCVGVSDHFTDPSTQIEHKCADYICYPEDPRASPADCKYHCPDYYDCLLREYDKRLTTASDLVTSEQNASHLTSSVVPSGFGIAAVDIIIISLSVVLVLAILIAIVLFIFFWKRRVCMLCPDVANPETELSELQSRTTVTTTTHSVPIESEARAISLETTFNSREPQPQSQTYVKTVETSLIPSVRSHASSLESRQYKDQKSMTLFGGPVIPGAPQYTQTNQGPYKISYARTSFHEQQRSHSAGSASSLRVIPPQQPSLCITESLSNVHRDQSMTQHLPSIPSLSTSVDSQHIDIFYDRSASPLSTGQSGHSSQKPVHLSSHSTQTDINSCQPASLEAATQTEALGGTSSPQGSSHQEVASVDTADLNEGDEPLSIPTQESSQTSSRSVHDPGPQQDSALPYLSPSQDSETEIIDSLTFQPHSHTSDSLTPRDALLPVFDSRQDNDGAQFEWLLSDPDHGIQRHQVYYSSDVSVNTLPSSSPPSEYDSPFGTNQNGHK